MKNGKSNNKTGTILNHTKWNIKQSKTTRIEKQKDKQWEIKQ